MNSKTESKGIKTRTLKKKVFLMWISNTSR